MTSTSIYTPITPTYLYIKQHSITGLKYFGKTTRDPYKYNGSGKHWSRHINKHGKEHIVTLWVSDLYHDTSIVEVALKFSADNDIVKSKEWANQKPENGLDGGASGTKHTQETKNKISASNKGKPLSEEHKTKLSVSQKGRKHTDETKAKQSASAKGKKHTEKTKAKMRKPRSDETKAKISATLTGKKRGPQSDETKAKISASNKGKPRKPQLEESNAKRSATMTGVSKPEFFSIIENRKTYGKSHLSRYYPEFKQYY